MAVCLSICGKKMEEQNYTEKLEIQSTTKFQTSCSARSQFVLRTTDESIFALMRVFLRSLSLLHL